jgi:virginiamycin B lyase
VGPDGSLWFTEQMVNKLGRLDPKTGEFKEYPLVEGKNSGPHGMVADRDGNIWFTANFGGYIGKPEYGGMRVISFLAGHGVLRDLAGTWVDANGMLWFTVQGGNMVGRLDPKTGKIELKEVPTEGALPYGIQINSKGAPIFCELGTNKMASINPQTMAITEYTLPAGVQPRRLAIAADDTVYFTDFKSGHLGTLNTTTRAVRLYASPGGGESNPYGITITPDGMVWYSESGVKPTTSPCNSIPRRKSLRALTLLPVEASFVSWPLLPMVASTLRVAA